MLPTHYLELPDLVSMKHDLSMLAKNADCSPQTPCRTNKPSANGQDLIQSD